MTEMVEVYRIIPNLWNTGVDHAPGQLIWPAKQSVIGLMLIHTTKAYCIAPQQGKAGTHIGPYPKTYFPDLIQGCVIRVWCGTAFLIMHKYQSLIPERANHGLHKFRWVYCISITHGNNSSRCSNDPGILGFMLKSGHNLV